MVGINIKRIFKLSEVYAVLLYCQQETRVIWCFAKINCKKVR